MKAHIVGVTAIEDPTQRIKDHGMGGTTTYSIQSFILAVFGLREISYLFQTPKYVEETNSLALPLVRGRVSQK